MTRYASEVVIYKYGDSEGPADDSDIPANVGDLWLDTTSGFPILKVCQSTSPWVWVPITVNQITYADPGSFQIDGADLTLDAGAGKDKPDTAYLAPIMGNLWGTDLTKTGNYLGGIIGAYSITGTGGSTYPKGAVLAQITDGSTDADGAVVAYIDGDSAKTNAGAAFTVKNNNSTPGSGFNYGLDLYVPARDGYPAATPLVADIRLSDGSTVTPTTLKRSITITIDGGGSVPSTGIKARWSSPVACTVEAWSLVGDASGDAVIDVLRSTYSGFPTTASIAGTDKPTLATAQKAENLGPLTDWGSTAIAANDVLEFDLSSVTTCKLLSLTLTLKVP